MVICYKRSGNTFPYSCRSTQCWRKYCDSARQTERWVCLWGDLTDWPWPLLCGTVAASANNRWPVQCLPTVADDWVSWSPRPAADIAAVHIDLGTSAQQHNVIDTGCMGAALCHRHTSSRRFRPFTRRWSNPGLNSCTGPAQRNSGVSYSRADGAPALSGVQWSFFQIM